MRPERLQALNARDPGRGPVVYWMSRDQRVADNWALVYAQQEALARQVPLAVVFALAPSFPGATARAYAFMLEGLRQVDESLKELGVPLFLLHGDPVAVVPAWVRQHKAGLLVTDFDPLRVKRQWREAVARTVDAACVEVDAHNIVPCRAASPKLEVGAYTLRPKLNRMVEGFLTAFPGLVRHPVAWRRPVPGTDWAAVVRGRGDAAVGPVRWLEPGEAAAQRALAGFIRRRLAAYDTQRNDPGLDGQSGLSPYLHFGQLSAQRVALAVSRSAATQEAKARFMEELIVRRELSDNFCHYQPHYDTTAGFPAWAQASHAAHAGDRRPYLYDRARLEAGATHDPLWNAAQREMVCHGKMHGYMRMYWAKKILEWTASPAEALDVALYLNDRYELDGRDPNGFAGVAWSIGGVHDRPWPERPVFGKIRCMTAGGCRSKFDVDRYIRRVDALAPA